MRHRIRLRKDVMAYQSNTKRAAIMAAVGSLPSQVDIFRFIHREFAFEVVPARSCAQLSATGKQTANRNGAQLAPKRLPNKSAHKLLI